MVWSASPQTLKVQIDLFCYQPLPSHTQSPATHHDRQVDRQKRVKSPLTTLKNYHYQNSILFLCRDDFGRVDIDHAESFYVGGLNELKLVCGYLSWPIGRF